MAVKNEKGTEEIWCDCHRMGSSFPDSCLLVIGVIGRAYLLPAVLGEEGASSAESVFIEMINKLFSTDLALPFIGGIFLCGILAAIMSTADSQLLVTASAASEDLYHQFVKKDADSKEVLTVSENHSYRCFCSGIYHCVESEQQYYGTGI